MDIEFSVDGEDVQDSKYILENKLIKAEGLVKEDDVDRVLRVLNQVRYEFRKILDDFVSENKDVLEVSLPKGTTVNLGVLRPLTDENLLDIIKNNDAIDKQDILNMAQDIEKRSKKIEYIAYIYAAAHATERLGENNGLVSEYRAAAISITNDKKSVDVDLEQALSELSRAKN